MIGVKPLFSGRSLGEGENADFDVVMVAPDGKPTGERKGLRYELLKIEHALPVVPPRRPLGLRADQVDASALPTAQLDVAPDKPARLSLPVKWGRYRLEVSTADAEWRGDLDRLRRRLVRRGQRRHAGHAGDRARQAEYKPGDAMTVAVTARDRRTRDAQCDQRPAGRQPVAGRQPPAPRKFALPVGKDWGTGAYVVATLRRPLDAQAQRMPGRAIGVQWFSIDRKARTLALDMKLPARMRPNTTLSVPIKIDGLKAGEEARIVVAAVDVGILNLTNYKPPAPDDYYLGQRRLTAEVRDLYGQLIDGMQGTRGADPHRRRLAARN